MSEDTSLQAKPKLTAAQIEKNCPPRLRQIGKEITARLAKADKQTQLAQDHLIAIEQLLAEAKQLCDGGGFKKFHELFCPQLGKSRAYALLAIAAGRKTLAGHRADTRARTAKSRAKKRAEASATVADKSEAERQDSPPEVAPADTPSIVPQQRPEAPRRAVKPKDDSLGEFTSLTCRLLQKIAKFPPRRFQKTGIKAGELARLGRFFSELADLKAGGEQKAISVTKASDSVSAEELAEGRVPVGQMPEMALADTSSGGLPPVIVKAIKKEKLQ